MAVKKTTRNKDESATPTKAEAKETAPKKKPAKAKAPAASTAPAPAPAPAPPPAASSTPEHEPATASKAAAPKKAAAGKKAAAPAVKLSTSQHEMLKKIGEAAEPGYTVDKKIEQRSIDALIEKKLVKKGAKDKATGSVRYLISNAGKKHMTS